MNLARRLHGRYMQRHTAATLGGVLFHAVPQRCPGKMVEVPNLLKSLG